MESSCKELNIDVEHVGLPTNSVSNVENYINSVDLVVTLGRGALESMACERNVIVFDINGGDGFVDEKSFHELKKHNFSGRRYSKKYSIEDFKKELLKYDPKLGKKLRKIVLEENSKKKTINTIINIYKEILNENEFNKNKVYFSLKKEYKEYNHEMLKTVMCFNETEQLVRKEQIIEQKNIELNQKEQQNQKIQKQIKKKKQQYKIIKQSNSKLIQNLEEIEEKYCTIQLSKSFRLGDLFFRSIKKPYKLLTFPINFIKILLDK